MAFAMNAVPTGWLAANGAGVSLTTYAGLYAIIGTRYGVELNSVGVEINFKLPDLRGYFVRGAGTNSDTVVSGGFGLKQADGFKSHTHTTSGELPTNNSSAGYKLPGSKVNVQGNGNQSVFSALDGAVIYHGHTLSNSGGTETRPANIAMLYCIKF